MANPVAQTTGPTDDDDRRAKELLPLTLGVIGVVYGDIGTSPLYALREAVAVAKSQGSAGSDAVIGILSLIVWTLLLIVTLKYVIVLLNADNRGEGGTFALMALGQSAARRTAPLILALGVAGAAFFYGDAVITPAISVLSAVEGLKLIAPAMEGAVLPLTVSILVALFAVQSRGTAAVARFFGPVMLLWFAAIAAGGAVHVMDDLTVFRALNPVLGIEFVAAHRVLGLAVMGLVFLVASGAAVIYVDLGHFGRRPIQMAWLAFVQPALVINYFGQGALLLAQPEAIDSPFYRLYPGWALIPMVVLATVATVIASQAVITGAFSFTRQAIQLGLLPRLRVLHTSESLAGQIFMPRVNQLLFVGVVMVTLVFRSSSSLAAAYGLAVSATIVIDSLLAFFVVWRCWRWPIWNALSLMIPLLLLEQAFLAANILKIPEGGWLPLLIAALISVIVFTWIRGSRALARTTRRNGTELEALAKKLDAKPPYRAPGTAVFFTGDPETAPIALMHNLKHNRVLHERNIILTIKSVDTPRVQRHERVRIERVADTFTRVAAHYGFMETPSVPKIVEHCRRKGLDLDIATTSFFVSRRSLKPAARSEMPRWQERLFIWLSRRADDATEYFRVPIDRVVEVGARVEV